MKFVIEEEDLKDLVAHLKRSKGEMYRTHFTEFNRVRCNGNLNIALKIIKEKHHPLAEEISQPKVKNNTLIKKEILLEELLHQIDGMMNFLLACSKSTSNIDMDKFKSQYTEVLNSINKYAAHNNIKFRKINGINGIEKLESALKNKDAFTGIFQLKRINEFLIDSAKPVYDLDDEKKTQRLLITANNLIDSCCEKIKKIPSDALKTSDVFLEYSKRDICNCCHKIFDVINKYCMIETILTPGFKIAENSLYPDKNGVTNYSALLSELDRFKLFVNYEMKKRKKDLLMEKEINPTHGLYAKDLITHECEFIESNPRNEYPIIDNIPRIIEVIKHVPIPNDVKELATEHITHLMNASSHDINTVAEGSYRAGYQDGIADLMGSLIKANLIDKNIVIDVDDMFEDEDYC